MQPLLGLSWWMRIFLGPITVAVIPLSTCGQPIPPTHIHECMTCEEQRELWVEFCEYYDLGEVTGECIEPELAEPDPCPFSTYNCAPSILPTGFGSTVQAG